MRGPKKRLTPFGKMVVKALADRDMSRAELAATVGTSPQYMSYILNGTRSGEKYLPGRSSPPSRSTRRRRSGRSRHDARKGGNGVPDVFITLEEAAAFESVSYKTLTQRIYRNPQQYKTKSQAREGGGKDQVLISTSSLSAKAREGMASRAEGGRE